MNEKTTANTKGTGKPRGKPFPKGVSGNPKGRPKDGESQSGIISYLLNCTPEQLAEMVGGSKTDLGRAFLQMPPKTQMKYLLPLRGMAAFMFEPNNSLWTTILERTEGKVKDQLDLTSGGNPLNWKQFIDNTESDSK